jgi:hypothetical protein
MGVRIALRCCVLFLSVLLIAEPVVFAQDQSSYDAKAHLHSAGTSKTIIVTFKDGTAEQGKVATLGDTTFALDQAEKGTNTFSYSKVVNVQGAPNAAKRRTTAIVLLVAIPLVIFGIVLGIVLSHRPNITVKNPALVPAPAR